MNHSHVCDWYSDCLVSVNHSHVCDWLQWLSGFREPLSPPYRCHGFKNVWCVHWFGGYCYAVCMSFKLFILLLAALPVCMNGSWCVCIFVCVFLNGMHINYYIKWTPDFSNPISFPWVVKCEGLFLVSFFSHMYLFTFVSGWHALWYYSGWLGVRNQLSCGDVCMCKCSCCMHMGAVCFAGALRNG